MSPGASSHTVFGANALPCLYLLFFITAASLPYNWWVPSTCYLPCWNIQSSSWPNIPTNRLNSLAPLLAMPSPFALAKRRRVSLAWHTDLLALQHTASSSVWGTALLPVKINYICEGIGFVSSHVSNDFPWFPICYVTRWEHGQPPVRPKHCWNFLYAEDQNYYLGSGSQFGAQRIYSVLLLDAI